MLCKVTSKNQLTLPKEIVNQFRNREYFDARIEDGHIVLEPMIVRPVVGRRLAEIRDKVAAEGLDELDVAGIVSEVRDARRP
jgi:bifunctional DNA-binding transcriptional regulator/antitoxin component of YhaV-PrlF toxin-antitoxin module